MPLDDVSGFRSDLLWDVHCHTEFAHCATTVTADKAIAGARAAGLGGLALTEHAFALYVTEPDVAWSWIWQDRPEVLHAIWDSHRGRMDQYLAFARARRSDRVLLGVEVDVMADGTLSLAPADREAWDVVVGAVHRITDHDRALDEGEANRRFLANVEALAAQGVDVLAHPFRWFVWSGRAVPESLFDPVIDLCLRYGVAAEINHHGGNANPPEFFRRCHRRGVKISLGTDSHAEEEIARLAPHVDVLRQAGVAEADWPEALFRPGGRRRTDPAP